MDAVAVLKDKVREYNAFMHAFKIKAGEEAVRHFKENFDRQGFVDSSVNPWEARKSSVQTHNILHKSGALKESIRVFGYTHDGVTVGSDIPYAQIHNEGGWALAYGKHPFLMPQRQFIGSSSLLERTLIIFLQEGIKRIFI